MSYPSGVQNTGRIVRSYPSGVQNTGRIVRSYPSGVQNTNVLRGVRALGSSFFSSVRVCTIRYESGKWHRSPSARKDELQGRARKSECPKRSVATQVFRISSRARSLRMYQANFPAPAGAFSCVKTRKVGGGWWGLAPHQWQMKGSGPAVPVWRAYAIRPYPDGSYIRIRKVSGGRWGLPPPALFF